MMCQVQTDAKTIQPQLFVCTRVVDENVGKNSLRRFTALEN